MKIELLACRSLLCAALVLFCSTAWPAEPANPKSNAATRALLNYFHELSNRTEGKRILSGQFSNFGNGANLRIMERVHETAGHWPALIGVDYADFPRGSLTTKIPNQVAINWMEELDLAADGPLELKQAGVVVLWRPFHEMNGGWFWWGAQDFDTFIQVWKHMFRYFSETKGLDNLLWVYGPNHGQNTARYYAGNSYVDIVGLDAYTDFIDPEHIKGYKEVAALPKPFGFTEFGPHGSQNPPGDYDYRRFIEGIEKNFPKTCFFMSWNGKWSLATNQFTRELLESPSILNREDLPKEAKWKN